MITTIPDVTPVTIPDVDPIVAIPVLPLLQVPPGIVSVNVIVVPGHTIDGPVITDTIGLTVIVFVTEQPKAVYEIIADPVAIPVTKPVDPTDATLVLLLLQLPPDDPSV